MGSRFLHWMVACSHDLERPGHGLGCRLNGRWHAQEILAGRRGILHLDIARHAFRIVFWQTYFMKRPAWAPVDDSPSQFRYKPLAHALLNHAAYFGIRCLEEVVSGKPLWCQDNLLGHVHTMPDIQPPAIRILDGVAVGAVQTTCFIVRELAWATDDEGTLGAEPPARDAFVEARHICQILWLKVGGVERTKVIQNKWVRSWKSPDAVFDVSPKALFEGSSEADVESVNDATPQAFLGRILLRPVLETLSEATADAGNAVDHWR